MKRVLPATLFLLLFTSSLFAQLQSPAEFLGYELGDQWTPHYKVESYFKHVADNSDMVTYQQYGSTYEGRELVYVVVTSEENQSNIEEISSDSEGARESEAGLLTEFCLNQIDVVLDFR